GRISGGPFPGSAGGPAKVDGPAPGGRRLRLVFRGDGSRTAERPCRGPQMVQQGRRVDGEEPAAQRRPPAFPGGSRGVARRHDEGTLGGCTSAAGAALTAKRVPHRPGIAPALGLRAGRWLLHSYRRPAAKGSVPMSQKGIGTLLGCSLLAVLLAYLLLD